MKKQIGKSLSQSHSTGTRPPSVSTAVIQTPHSAILQTTPKLKGIHESSSLNTFWWSSFLPHIQSQKIRMFCLPNWHANLILTLTLRTPNVTPSPSASFAASPGNHSSDRKCQFQRAWRFMAGDGACSAASLEMEVIKVHDPLHQGHQGQLRQEGQKQEHWRWGLEEAPPRMREALQYGKAYRRVNTISVLLKLHLQIDTQGASSNEPGGQVDHPPIPHSNRTTADISETVISHGCHEGASPSQNPGSSVIESQRRPPSPSMLLQRTPSLSHQNPGPPSSDPEFQTTKGLQACRAQHLKSVENNKLEPQPGKGNDKDGSVLPVPGDSQRLVDGQDVKSKDTKWKHRRKARREGVLGDRSLALAALVPNYRFPYSSYANAIGVLRLCGRVLALLSIDKV
ncbi:hypothetical protein QBC45DRAFT_158837 [Copromyces sp. CBS 386.78]|nr:hypothetical protein QBC45DRAFT_158837 [Copromyces sp. CBS 386.78]